MNNLKRLIWCALLFGIQALYFPLNRFLQGGMEFKTALDDYVPLWPIWVIPYGLICIWWIVAHLWAAWRMEERLYESFFIASAFASVAALTIYTIFPTYVIRPEVSANDWTSQLLNWIYTNDYDYNAFPSGHVYITTLIALFWSLWFPKWRWLWIATVILVAFATLFTHQHYLPDPVGGLALAWFSYRIGLWCMTERNTGQRPVLDSP
ncbi:MAG TPA: phosphatase PAP2 family protein [Anaerolineales bacterium]|nr:phosphatase PAP2 family protein [Anaerolineales bacterium]